VHQRHCYPSARHDDGLSLDRVQRGAADQRCSLSRHDWAGIRQPLACCIFRFASCGKAEPRELDHLHSVYRDALESLLGEYGMTDFSAAEREELTLAWQRLVPWPDVVPGLTRPKKRFTVAALSNADLSTVVSISKHVGLPWDAVFTGKWPGCSNATRRPTTRPRNTSESCHPRS
jgi:hypothetical protein